MEKFKTIINNAEAEIVEKRSKFIANIYYVKSLEEVEEKLKDIKKKYFDSRHNCYAYRIEDEDTIIERASDDGEPSGTAGAPILNILNKMELMNVLVIVTRYFGGIKLGAGGLVRAYSKSVLEAIEASEIIEVEYYDVYNITFDYSDLKDIEREIRNSKLTIIQKDFGEKISYDLVSKNNRNIKEIFEKFHNKIKVNFKNKQVLKKIK